LPGQPVTQTHEKDFDGYKVNLSYDAQNYHDLSFGVEGILLYKDFSDSHTINSNGILSTDSYRQDYLSYLNLYATHPINDWLDWRLDLQLSRTRATSTFTIRATRRRSLMTFSSIILWICFSFASPVADRPKRDRKK